MSPKMYEALVRFETAANELWAAWIEQGDFDYDDGTSHGYPFDADFGDVVNDIRVWRNTAEEILRQDEKE